MNSWPTLKEWSASGGTLAVEILIIFALTRLAVLRIKSAQWARALWQIAIAAMFVVVAGELSGARGFIRLPRKQIAAAPQRAVTVTIKDADLALDPSLFNPPPAPSLEAFPPRRNSTWEQRVRWPVVIWCAGALLVMGRAMLGQVLAILFRSSCHQVAEAEIARMAERVRSALRIRRRIRLVQSARAIAPFTFGILGPVIVLPRTFAGTYTAEQQEAALAHELAHVAGFDSAWRFLSDCVCALLWWHPLVWLARRELVHVSELAADEASLLIADGPNRLAECLLACAKEVRKPALVAWLGMDGGGFRSALGKRISRLLQLTPGGSVLRGVPWYWRMIAPLLCVAVLWLGMAVTGHSPQHRGFGWRCSILGTAFAAAVEEQSPKEKDATRESLLRELQQHGITFEESRTYVGKLVQDGKLYYEAGRLSEAERALRSALKIDPANQGALYYLDLVAARRTAAGLLLKEVEQEWTPPVTTNYASMSQEQRELYEKLRRIRLAEWGPIDNLPLGEVVRGLSDAARAADPEHKGISIVVNSTPVARANAVDAAGLPLAKTNEVVDLNSAVVQLGTNLRDLSLEQALNILMAVAERKIQYSVEPFGVVISSKVDKPVELHTRFFHVDPNTVQRGLRDVTPFNFDGARPGSGGQPARRGRIPTSEMHGVRTNAGTDFLSEAITNAPIIPLLQKFFASAGIDVTAPGKALFFNDRLGVLMVRATPQDLDTIEKAIQLLNVSPPQLTIRVKVMEVPASSAADGSVLFGLTNQSPANVSPSQEAFTNSGKPTLQGILTAEQFQSLIRTLEKGGGTDLMSAPEVTTMSGRQAQIKVVDIRYIVTGLDYGTNNAAGKGGNTNQPVVTGGEAGEPMPIAEPFELGPVVDIVPYVLPDGYTIQMTVLPKLREFLGYDDPATVWATGGPFAPPDSGRPTQPVPLPKFRLREAAATALVWDGQTLVLGVGTARNVTRERHRDHTVTTNYTDKALFFFITPRIVDPAGNPVHSNEELPFHKNMPEQSGAIDSGLRKSAGQ